MRATAVISGVADGAGVAGISYDAVGLASGRRRVHEEDAETRRHVAIDRKEGRKEEASESRTRGPKNSQTRNLGPWCLVSPVSPFAKAETRMLAYFLILK